MRNRERAGRQKGGGVEREQRDREEEK